MEVGDGKNFNSYVPVNKDCVALFAGRSAQVSVEYLECDAVRSEALRKREATGGQGQSTEYLNEKRTRPSPAPMINTFGDMVA